MTYLNGTAGELLPHCNLEVVHLEQNFYYVALKPVTFVFCDLDCAELHLKTVAIHWCEQRIRLVVWWR